VPSGSECRVREQVREERGSEGPSIPILTAAPRTRYGKVQKRFPRASRPSEPPSANCTPVEVGGYPRQGLGGVKVFPCAGLEPQKPRLPAAAARFPFAR